MMKSTWKLFVDRRAKGEYQILVKDFYSWFIHYYLLFYMVFVMANGKNCEFNTSDGTTKKQNLIEL